MHNKKLITTLVMSSLVASAFAVSAGAANDKQVLKNEKGQVHNVVGKLGKVSGATAEERALAALDQVGGEFGFGKAAGHFKAKESHVANGVTHTKLDRVINGVKVFGDQMIVHEANGDVQGVTGTWEALAPNATSASLNADEAIKRGVAHTGFKGDLSVPATAELVYLPHDGKAALTYQVKVSYLGTDGDAGNWDLFVDANSGAVVDAVNKVETVKPGGGGSTGGTAATGTGTGVLGGKKTINTTFQNGTYYLIDQSKYMFQANGGTITTKNYNNTNTMSDMTDADNVWDQSVQRAGVDAHYYAGKTYDYYYNNLGQNSVDNAGKTLLSGVHYGTNYNNAFWNGSQMTYGDGDGVTFISLSGGFDVVAHELTHGVTENTSNLVYRDQSGALNESWSDAMAAAIEGANWLIGEDVYTPGTPGDALRSMSNPNAYGDPENMSQYVNTSSDNGGVHTNSGIPNKAFYNFATGINSRAIAAKVWYTASRDYMTSRTDFSGARAATLQAAAALYGSTSSTYTALQNAWSAVGVN